jgi:hypothetical protein
MNRDGSILVVGAPEANGQYFANFRGIWQAYQEYFEDDVVKYNGNYYQLRDTVLDSALDSTLIVSSKNQNPSAGDPWYYIESTIDVAAGKVFVYKRTSNDVYELKQVISNGNLDSISDLTTDENIESGDNFGSSVDIDYTGTTIIASSPKADNKFVDQGAVYVFKTSDMSSGVYRLKQKLISHETYANEFFGTDIAISSATERIVVGARNATFRLEASFDTRTTTFDNTNTKFFNQEGSTGQVYVFDRKDQSYFLTEKLLTDNFQDWESFGYSVDCYGSVIAVGSPTFRNNLYTKLNGIIPIR